MDRRSFFKKTALFLAAVPFVGIAKEKLAPLTTAEMLPARSLNNKILAPNELSKKGLLSMEKSMTALADKIDAEALELYKQREEDRLFIAGDLWPDHIIKENKLANKGRRKLAINRIS